MSVIFNEPGGGQTLSNPSQQNNVFQFVQLTAPTERSSGVALVDGDRWFKPTDNGIFGTAGWWFYRIAQSDPLVAYWLSEERFLIQNGLFQKSQASFNTAIQGVVDASAAGTISNSLSGAGQPLPFTTDLVWADAWSIALKPAATGTVGYTINESNSFQLFPLKLIASSTATNAYLDAAITIDSFSDLLSVSTIAGGTVSYKTIGNAIGKVFDLNGYGQVAVRPTIAASVIAGTPVVGQSFDITTTMYYRQIHP